MRGQVRSNADVISSREQLDGGEIRSVVRRFGHLGAALVFANHFFFLLCLPLGHVELRRHS